MKRAENDIKCVSVLLSVYEPNIDWLKELLESLNKQTYKNIKLYIRDDCSPTVPFESVKKIVHDYVTAFPYVIKRNDSNVGSNATFEVLTREADGDYFAYCDQDDVWLPNKIALLVGCLEKENGIMAYSDMSVVDASGKILANSLKDIRTRIRYVSGEDLARVYFFRNCTAGCAMLIAADVAKKALPFPKKTIHDQWLSIVAAQCGKICFCQQPLVYYRQHGGNQTGVLSGVVDKVSYYEKRINPLIERLDQYEKCFGKDELLEDFVRARIEKNIFRIWKNRKLSPIEAKFEVVMKFLPEGAFKRIVRTLK